MSSTYSYFRLALLGDAVASGAAGLLAFLGADVLAELLGLPVSLLRYAGLVLLLCAAVMSWLGMRPEPSQRAVLAVIGINLFWVVDSVALLASGWVAPTALGSAFLVLQALIVAGFATAQVCLALRGNAARPQAST